MQRVDVLQDVALAVGDEDDVEFVEGLVDEADVVLLDGGVLGGGVGELGERGQEGFDAGSLHLAELAGEDGFAGAGGDGCGEDDLGFL